MINKDKKIIEKYPFLKELTEFGYSNFKEIPGKGICCLQNFIFTTGLMVNITKDNYQKRYCYEDFDEALSALDNFNEKDIHPQGNWIKLKGFDIIDGKLCPVDLLNPIFLKDNNSNNNSKKIKLGK